MRVQRYKKNGKQQIIKSFFETFYKVGGILTIKTKEFVLYCLRFK